MQTIVSSYVFVALALAATATAAQDNRAVSGADLARACASCHGTDGQGGGAIPPLAGLDAEWLVARMQAFARGEATDATIMPRLLAPLTDDEIAALAAHFAGIGP